MWLWLAHNKANARLSGDATEDPNHPKVQFPTRLQCRDCYAVDDELVWNEQRVLSFLEGYYGVDAVIDDDVHDNFNSSLGIGFSVSLACHSRSLASLISFAVIVVSRLG